MTMLQGRQSAYNSASQAFYGQDDPQKAGSFH